MADPELMNDLHLGTRLVPLLSTICRAAERAEALHVLGDVFQKIMLAWVDRVLGPAPADRQSRGIYEWLVMQSKGVQMLKLISSDADELKQLLGEEHDRILAALKDTPRLAEQDTSSGQRPKKKRKTMSDAAGVTH